MSTLVLLFFLHAMRVACDCRNIEAYLLKSAEGGVLGPAWRFSIPLRFCASHMQTCGWHAESCDLREKRLMCLTMMTLSPQSQGRYAGFGPLLTRAHSRGSMELFRHTSNETNGDINSYLMIPKAPPSSLPLLSLVYMYMEKIKQKSSL